jgi:hypothetical protein
MARGTGRDNATTQWSVNAIEQRTGISRPNADKAVKDLLARGVWKKTRDGKHPIYEAVPGNQIPGGPFSSAEQAVITGIRNGSAPPNHAKPAAEALKAHGVIRERTTSRRNGYFDINEAAIAALSESAQVWLPNALIDGAAGEVPPVELIRQTRSLPALRLLIELYAVQFLPIYGGVPPELLMGVFDRAKVGEQGPFVIWGFKPKTSIAGHSLYRHFLCGQHVTNADLKTRDIGIERDFWPAVRTLEGLGLTQTVGMLRDGDDDQAEVIHPYGIDGGESLERELAEVAHRAARGMVTEGQAIWADENEFYHLVPVQRHIANVAMIEVYRLKYRPHTKATAAWYAQMHANASEHLARYHALTSRIAATSAA